MATSRMYGYEVFWSEADDEWKYMDTKESVKDNPRENESILDYLEVSESGIKIIRESINKAEMRDGRLKCTIDFIINDPALTTFEKGYALFKLGFDRGNLRV